MRQLARSLAVLLTLAGAVPAVARAESIPTLDLRKDGSVSSLRVRVDYRKPEGQGPFPAVVLLHGCAGWYGGNIADWSEWFRRRGYATLAIDSLTTRGVDHVCTEKARGLVTHLMRLGDAYAGLLYLDRRPEVDSRRVVLMGFSHGARTATMALNRDLWELYFEPGRPRFVAAIAMYPYCTYGKMDFYAPLKIISGSEDTWTPPGPCQGWLDDNAGRAEPIEVDVLDGASHSFDSFSWRGQRVGRRYSSHSGHLLEPNREATERARALVADFLQRRVGLP